MLRYGIAFDEAIIYDGPRAGFNILNSAAFEVLARDAYGLIKAHEKCARGKEKGKSGVAPRWQLRDEYDIAAQRGGDIVARRADNEVANVMARRARTERVLGPGRAE